VANKPTVKGREAGISCPPFVSQMKPALFPTVIVKLSKPLLQTARGVFEANVQSVAGYSFLTQPLRSATD
jgi:hypothetical protein